MSSLTFVECDVFQATQNSAARLFLQDASSQGDYGVRINVLCPAFVDTPLLHSVEHEDNMGKFVKFKDDFRRSMTKFGVLQWVNSHTLLFSHGVNLSWWREILDPLLQLK